MEGKGKYIDSSGFTYTGEFKANRFDGFGERKETDGFIYIGEFKKDIRHGLGTLIYTNGSKITAKWDYDSITSENLKVEIKNDKQIPLIPYANGLYKIPVRINNALDLLLLFDTGVSETIIDDRNIQYLINKNIISENDVLRTSEHKFADGFKRKKITYKINSLVIGKYPIDNPVLATFEDENVELILGNKMISKLGKIQIDYKNHILTIVK
jgi:hypothetical protein